MNDERIAQFNDEAAQLSLRGGRGDTERLLLMLAVLGLVLGVVLVVVGGVVVSGAATTVDQNAALATSTFIGLALVLAGGALFVRYSLARFLRFWLVRLVHEQRTETDRIIAALGATQPTNPTGASDQQAAGSSQTPA
jgi:cytochrome c biogenesis protein CcdA